MKHLLTLVLLIISSNIFAQHIVPGSPAIDKSLLKPASYKMIWFALNGNEKREIGETKIDILINDETLTVIQEVFLKNAPVKWIDTTIAKAGSLIPVYHSSTNMMRDMALTFGPDGVKGHYTDKRKNQTAVINDSIKESYFDSNLYTYLIAWLPLQENYRTTLPIYNYSDATTHGIGYVKIDGVTEAKYKLLSGASVSIYEVSVIDPIVNNTTRYYIGKENRNIYQVDAQTPRGTMQMIRVN
jgi:hypothetical protein